MTKNVIELAREAGFGGYADQAANMFRQYADLVAARERERLDFLCSTGKQRRIEHQKGLWRVYQDEAPTESEHSDWQAMTYLFHTTPGEAIDAAIQHEGASNAGS